MATQTYQSEAELENQLIMQLKEQDYASVEINDYDALLANFREQFCKFNNRNPETLHICMRLPW